MSIDPASAPDSSKPQAPVHSLSRKSNIVTLTDLHSRPAEVSNPNVSKKINSRVVTLRDLPRDPDEHEMAAAVIAEATAEIKEVNNKMDQLLQRMEQHQASSSEQLEEIHDKIILLGEKPSENLKLDVNIMELFLKHMRLGKEMIVNAASHGSNLVKRISPSFNEQEFWYIKISLISLVALTLILIFWKNNFSAHNVEEHLR